MKKNTFLMLLILLYTAINYAQCINTNAYPSESIVSDNSGDFQQINSCVYTGDFSTVSNITLGSTYTFEIRTEGGVPVTKYLTVTDINNNVIAHGLTPLIINSISETSIRLHYSEDATCATEQLCLAPYIKVTLPCPFPTNIQISEVTTTHASFNWTPGDAETMWEVMVLPSNGESPTPTTTGTAVTGNPTYEYTTLTAGQSYKFYIRANCGDEFSPWRGPYLFNSGCDAITEFTENFDGTTDGTLPSCWTGLLVNAAPYASISINGLSNSSPNAVQLANDNSGATAQILLISPNLSTVATATHRLKFYTRGYGNVTLEVGTINTTTSDGVFNTIETINATANYTEHIVDFTGYSGTDTHIAFRHANTSTYNPVFIDDVTWEPSPSCPDVQNIELTNLSQNTATLGWTPADTPTAWDVVYSQTATNPNSLTPISSAPNTPSVIISDLQPNTTYKAWVRSSCDDGADKGAWMNPITFTTPCEATNSINEDFEDENYGELPECWSSIITNSLLNSTVGVNTNNAYEGNNAVSLFNGDETGDSKIILVSPSLATLTTGTHRVKFFARSNGEATIEVGTLDSPANGSTFSDFQTINTTSNYTEYVVDFSTYVGTDTYLGFKHTSGQYISIYIDNIRWELTPACADVTEIEVNNVTAASAHLEWMANAGENQWDVVYGTDEVTNPTTLTPMSPAPSGNSEITLNDLTDNTVYKVWVRSVCEAPQGNGAWIGPLTFRTACLPTVAFNEGFETTNYGELPDCWSRVLAGPTLGQYAAVRTVTNDAAFGTNAVEIHANSSAPTDFVMLVSPYLNSLTTATHRLKFYALSYNTDTPLEIGTMDGNTSTATYTPFTTLTLGTGYNEYTIDFTTYSGTDTYIAFRNTAGNYNSTFLDNIRWEVVPTCQDVTAISAEDIQAEAASIYWTPTGTEENWQVVYGPDSVSDPYTLTPSEVLSIPSYETEGLTENTSYNVWVRSVCGGTDGNGSWIGPITFKTACSYTTVPYIQNFESVNLPAIPECSSIENIGMGNNWDTTYGDSGYGFEGYVLRYNGNSSDATAWFYTQGIQLTAGVEYTISYKYGNNSSDNYSENLQVLYGTAPNITAMTTEIADHPGINTGMATTNAVNFTPETTGIYYIGFQAYSTANQSQLYLDNIEVTGSLSTPTVEQNKLSYYPNPVKDLLHLSFNNEISKVIVHNLLGQKVVEFKLNTTQAKLNLAGLSTGSYLLKVFSGRSIKTIKIIKE